MSINLSCLKMHGIDFSMSAGLLLDRLCLLDVEKILELGRRVRCNFHKHVLSCPSGFAHVQSPNARIIPAASPVSFSSVLHQGFSLRHISSVTRGGEPPRRGLWRTAPAGPDGRALQRWTTHTERGENAECTPPALPLYLFLFISCLFSFLNHETGNWNRHLQNHVKTAVWWMWDLASLPNVILRFMAVYRS